jgi:hypothetical protein
MKAISTASGGVMFIPEEVERKIPKITEKTCNDNLQGQEQQQR